MNRRSLLLGIGSLIAAPAVVRAENIMKIAGLRQSIGIAGIITDPLWVNDIWTDGIHPTPEGARMALLNMQAWMLEQARSRDLIAWPIPILPRAVDADLIEA